VLVNEIQLPSNVHVIAQRNQPTVTSLLIKRGKCNVPPIVVMKFGLLLINFGGFLVYNLCQTL
jgi:hypothetical protein